MRPNTTVDCPAGVPTGRCVTIMDIAASTSEYFRSNTQINFLAGVHYITNANRMRIDGSKVTDVSLIGEQGNTIIYCNGTQFGFHFLIYPI